MQARRQIKVSWGTQCRRRPGVKVKVEVRVSGKDYGLGVRPGLIVLRTPLHSGVEKRAVCKHLPELRIPSEMTIVVIPLEDLMMRQHPLTLRGDPRRQECRRELSVILCHCGLKDIMEERNDDRLRIFTSSQGPGVRVWLKIGLGVRVGRVTRGRRGESPGGCLKAVFTEI